MKKKTIKNQNQFVTSRGSDPEFFLRNVETGKIESAIGIIKRDKYNPIMLNKDTGFYFDNCQAEFTIRPAFSKEDFVSSFRDSLTLIHNYFENEHNGKYEMAIQASHSFEEEEIDNEEAMKIGCTPEFCADSVSMVTPPDFSGTLRSSGGHLSMGRADFEEMYKKGIDRSNLILLNFQSRIDLAKLLDYYVGVSFTLLDNDPTSIARRSIYGQPSSHRCPKFGLEYRVLSCYWISSPKLVELIYDLSEFAIQKLIKNEENEVFAVDKKLVNACIKENNKELAAEIIDMIDFPGELKDKLNEYRNVQNWDFYNEWNLQRNLVHA